MSICYLIVEKHECGSNSLWYCTTWQRRSV